MSGSKLIVNHFFPFAQCLHSRVLIPLTHFRGFYWMNILHHFADMSLLGWPAMYAIFCRFSSQIFFSLVLWSNFIRHPLS